jgi:tetratricopeptide (TPR) repeat protein
VRYTNKPVEAYHWRARYHHELRQYDFAIRDIKVAISLDSANKDYRKDLNDMLFFAGRYTEAFQAARQFLLTSPPAPDKFVTNFIVCVTGQITGNDIRIYDQQFDNALEAGADLTAFDARAVEEWLPGCPAQSRAYVVSLLEKYRAKLK